MELLTAGAITLVTLLGNKALNKASDKVIDVVFEQGDKVIKLLRFKFPDIAKLIEVAVENLPLPPGQPEDIGEAVLIQKIESAASQDPEIKAAVETLASDAQAAAKVNPQLATAIDELTKAIQSQQPLSQNPAKLAETIGIKAKKISGSKFYQNLGSGDINIDRI